MPFSLPHRCFSVIKNADNSNKYNQHTWAKFGFRFGGANPLLPLALEVGPLPSVLSPLPSIRSKPSYIQPGGMGERSKLPQRGLGQSPAKIAFGAF